jgi:hypothetical protein
MPTREQMIKKIKAELEAMDLILGEHMQTINGQTAYYAEDEMGHKSFENYTLPSLYAELCF